nr:protein delta-1 [Bacillus phage phi29]
MIDLELEKKMTKLEHENKLMKNALYELSRMENNDYATWVIKVLFGGAPHGAK